jgi:DNA repair protein RadC
VETVDPGNGRIIAKRLLDEFSTLGCLWSQPPEAMARILGQNSSVARLLFVSREALLESMRGDLQRRKLDPSSHKLIDYLRASMGALPDEALRVLFLDGSRGLIADEQMQRGTIGHLTLYPRIIFRRAMELDAASLILVHNHPSGDPTPSENDRLVTARLVDIGRSLDVAILDHIIVTATDHYRMLQRKGWTGTGRSGSMFDLRERRRRGEQLAKERAAALANARRIVRRRMLRKQLLGGDRLFGEPAWDMLIDLFIHECEGKPVSTSSLCIASGLPMSSALRLLQRLSDARFLVRKADPSDGRRNFIKLAPDIAHRLGAYFAEGDE